MEQRLKGLFPWNYLVSYFFTIFAKKHKAREELSGSAFQPTRISSTDLEFVGCRKSRKYVGGSYQSGVTEADKLI